MESIFHGFFIFPQAKHRVIPNMEMVMMDYFCLDTQGLSEEAAVLDNFGLVLQFYKFYKSTKRFKWLQVNPISHV